jgi:hypothetical protein
MDGSHHTPPESPSPDAPAGLHRAELDRLIAIGMKFAERLGEAADDRQADVSKASLVFARVARAVRQTVALEALLADQARVRAERERYEAQLAREEAEIDCPWLALGLTEAEYDARNEAFRREASAHQLVKGVIKHQYDKDDRESLTLDLEELLEDKEKFFSDEPLSEVIAGICRDLGLEPDWSGLSRKDWDAIDLRTRVELKALSPPGPIPPLYGEGGEGRSPETGGERFATPPPEDAFADP